jgi:exo-beta-1,3-glucanase (GH17 family)
MKKGYKYRVGLGSVKLFLVFVFISITIFACKQKTTEQILTKPVTAQDILGNPEYQAISYGGYRMSSRDIQPSISDIKEDLEILSELGIKLIRTYNVHLPHASNILKAIEELTSENAEFEMYVMLGAWINCKNAFTELSPDHTVESNKNEVEIGEAVKLANKHPEIVKIIAVGNEAMVKWAASYYVEPGIILKWVRHLQELKAKGDLSKDLWITSSDNFASWGGGSDEYHVPTLDSLITEVDYISMHTYPMHDTHHNPAFWNKVLTNTDDSIEMQIDTLMTRALSYAQYQYQAVENYTMKIGIEKPIHIGETGWASYSGGFYGPEGSRACDEYKQALYYHKMRAWTDTDSISCFYFEAFDEKWKDAEHPNGSENHFGLFTSDGQAKYALWDSVNLLNSKQLRRGESSMKKTFNGQLEKLLETVFIPNNEITQK